MGWRGGEGGGEQSRLSVCQAILLNQSQVHVGIMIIVLGGCSGLEVLKALKV